jgi:hypothetical protein
MADSTFTLKPGASVQIALQVLDADGHPLINAEGNPAGVQNLAYSQQGNGAVVLTPNPKGVLATYKTPGNVEIIVNGQNLDGGLLTPGTSDGALSVPLAARLVLLAG